MVDWTSPQALARDAAALSRLIHVVAGVYLWEYVFSLDFEWSFIRGRRKFNWPMIPYFLGRYFELGVVVTTIISVDSTTPLNCQALYTILFILGASTFCFSSINLAIRTMVVWNMQWVCVAALCLLSLFQWILSILVIASVRAELIPGEGCLVTHTWARGMSAVLLYSVCFDLIVLTLCAAKLLILNPDRRSQLVNLLFRDGIIYFIVSVVGNIPAATIALLQLNPLMDIMAALPASALATVAASRAVRRLSNFSTNGPAVYLTTTKPPLPTINTSNTIQVQMDTLTTSDGHSKEASSFV